MSFLNALNKFTPNLVLVSLSLSTKSLAKHGGIEQNFVISFLKQKLSKAGWRKQTKKYMCKSFP